MGSEEAPNPHEGVTRERLFQGHAGRIVPESFEEVNPEGRRRIPSLPDPGVMRLAKSQFSSTPTSRKDADPRYFLVDSWARCEYGRHGSLPLMRIEPLARWRCRGGPVAREEASPSVSPHFSRRGGIVECRLKAHDGWRLVSGC